MKRFVLTGIGIGVEVGVGVLVGIWLAIDNV